MLKRIKYNTINKLSPQGSRSWLNLACKMCRKNDINSVQIVRKFLLKLLNKLSCSQAIQIQLVVRYLAELIH